MICVNSITAYPKSITLKVDSWYYGAYAEVCPSNAHCKEIYWYSEDPSIASVNAFSGYIKANAAGNTRIHATATDGSGCSDYITVTVSNAVPVTSVTLDHSAITIEEGQQFSITATVSPEYASNTALNWTSSNNSIATVTNGVVTAVAKGFARITATAADGSGKSASCNVTVSGDTLVSQICVSPDTLTLLTDKSEYLKTTVYPANATNKCVTWSSDDPNIATVNQESGLVYAESAGTTVIRATAQDGSGVVGYCNITVNDPIMVDRISISPETFTIGIGESAKLYADVFPSNAHRKTVRWSSENCNIAEIDYITGCVTGKAIGTTKIYATAQDGSGVYGVCQLNVRFIPVDSISIVPKKKTIEAGKVTKLYANISPSNASNKSVIWATNDPSVATVDTYTGKVTAHMDGTAIITASTVSGGKTDTCSIIVDSREKVTIREDAHSFYIQFHNGPKWENIGCDMLKAENRSGHNLWDCECEEEVYLRTHERRYKRNVAQTFTAKQVAFIYLFDPLGIEYYMKNYNNHDPEISPANILFFKDEVYEGIFGVKPRLFNVMPSGQLQYYHYTDDTSDEFRLSVYSFAEAIFGFHRLENINLVTIVSSILEAIFDFIPHGSNILYSVPAYQALFFSGAVSDGLCSASISFLDDYIAKTPYTSALDVFGWANTVLGVLKDILYPESLHNVTICNTVNTKNFNATFSIGNGEYTIEEVIKKYQDCAE